MRHISVARRRARAGLRHRLAGGARASTVEDATRSLVALHATDPATVFLSLRARVPGVTVEGVERALYEHRTLVRMMAMRRTLFVVPAESVPVVQAAAGRAVGVTQRRRYLSLMTSNPMADVPGDVVTDRASWLADVENETLLALDGRGTATGAELARDVPRLGATVHMSPEKSYGAEQKITSWVLNLMALDGRIVRTRPRGTWVSQQWRWAPAEAWLPPGTGDVSVEEARARLVRLYLARFGPAPVADIKWWTGWPLGQVRAALAAIGPEEVDLDGATGVMLRDDAGHDEPGHDEPEPWVALLPALDPTPMGWASRDWFLGPHAGRVFDRNGNVGPTVWCDGRIVGGWAQRADGEVVTRLLEDVGTEAAAAVETAAADLAAWVGPVRVTPRFRTPLEKELTA